MKIFIFILSLFYCIFLTFKVYPADYSRLDHHLKRLVQKSGMKKAKGMDIGPELVPIFIIVDDLTVVQERIRDYGGRVGSSIDDILTAYVPLTSLLPLSEMEEVRYIKSSHKIKARLDKALPMVGALSVHDGESLEGKYTGKGVIVGVVDSSIDWNHEAFRDENGEVRIKYIWDQRYTDGVPPQGFEYGHECNREEIRKEDCRLYPIDEHGTMVTAAAAGSGHDGEKYTGIAPDADIVFVSMMAELDIYLVDAVNYIFQKADSLGMPAVVNLSLGYHTGPHDGTSPTERALDALTGPGRIIVVSAGNEGMDGAYFNQHIGFTASTVGKKAAFYIIKPYQEVVFEEPTIDIWYDGHDEIEFSIEVGSFTGLREKTGFAAPGDLVEEMIYFDGVYLGSITIDATTADDPDNHDRHVAIYIGDENQDCSELYLNLIWYLVVRGNGSFDGWMDDAGFFFGEESGFDFLGIENGDGMKTVGLPATASKVISVGSYISRDTWTDYHGNELEELTIDGTKVTVNNISEFSSHGPSRDPDITGIKPEITAPGEVIVSAIPSSPNSFKSPDNEYPAMIEGEILINGGPLSIKGDISLFMDIDDIFFTNLLHLVIYLGNCLDKVEISIGVTPELFSSLIVDISPESPCSWDSCFYSGCADIQMTMDYNDYTSFYEGAGGGTIELIDDESGRILILNVSLTGNEGMVDFREVVLSISDSYFSVSDGCEDSFELVMEDDVETDRGEGYSIAYGTSFSSPIVAGAVALLLERDESLTPKKVEELLIKGADSDMLTGDVPNDIWGYGRLNIFKSMKELEGKSGGGGGGGGCGCMIYGDYSSNKTVIINFFVYCLSIIIIYFLMHFATKTPSYEEQNS